MKRSALALTLRRHFRYSNPLVIILIGKEGFDMSSSRWLCIGLASIALPAFVAAAQNIPASEAPGAIRAVLEAKCYPCHGAETQKNGLRLDSMESLKNGGDSGKPALVAGDPLVSELVRRITLPREHADAMPPAGEPALSADETLGVIRWISRGATWAPVETAPAADATPAADPAAPQGVSFAGEIAPILEASCYTCHGAERQRGDLRLDSIEAIQRGSENGPVVVSGNPEESLLYKLTTLPPGHPDFMPGQGDPLTSEQSERIRRWILEGAVFDSPPVAAVAQAPAGSTEPTFEAVLAALARGVSPAPADALSVFGQWGALALPLDQKTPLLQIDFQRASTGVGDEQLRQLAAVANQVTWLNLAGTDVTNDDLAQIARLTNLTKLHLERTSISDEGLAHLTALPNLQYLNLYGTQVTDTGLDHLKQLPALQKVFLWQSGVTKEGALRLADARPGLLIDLGWEAPEPTPVAEAAPAAFDEGSCCAKAANDGKDCEHPCCVEARAAGTLCAKCNPNNAAFIRAAPAAFDEGSCCAKAADDGKDCEHPCCIEARTAGKVCAKCNPNNAL
jgi:hypothetical protein